jgi:hypothetical protein
MNWIFLFSAGFLFLVALLLLGLERGDRVGEVIFNVMGSTPIMAVAVVYFSIWMYAVRRLPRQRNDVWASMPVAARALHISKNYADGSLRIAWLHSQI